MWTGGVGMTLRHGASSSIDVDKKNGANYLFADCHVEFSMEYHRARASGGTVAAKSSTCRTGKRPRPGGSGYVLPSSGMRSVR